MKRKQFLKQTALSLPLLSTTSALLAGCKKEDCVQSFTGKVIVIGAGAAGLYAAHLLKQKDLSVTVLEASGQIGGRLRPLTGFADFPIELGAEEVHGNKSTWYNIVKNSGTSFINIETEDYFLYNGNLSAVSAVSNNADVAKVYSFNDNLYKYTGADVPVQQVIDSFGNTSKVTALYTALLGNERGTSNTRLGARSAAIEDEKWTAGDDNYMISGKHYLEILQAHCSDIIPHVLLNKPVTKIDYNGTNVSVTCPGGETFTADKVLITVPLAVLQTNSIQFVPALPPAKTSAINAIGMDAGMKIILRFSARFWAEDTGSVYGPNYIPEFWVTSLGRSSTAHVLTAYVMGDKAAFLSTQGSNAINYALQDLDALYGAGVASDSLQDSYIMDWSKEPYIQGAFSYASVGSSAYREVLQQPVNNLLYFAGEATNTSGHIGTVHGAIESAEKAAQQIVCGG